MNVKKLYVESDAFVLYNITRTCPSTISTNTKCIINRVYQSNLQLKQFPLKHLEGGTRTVDTIILPHNCFRLTRKDWG